MFSCESQVEVFPSFNNLQCQLCCCFALMYLKLCLYILKISGLKILQLHLLLLLQWDILMICKFSCVTKDVFSSTWHFCKFRTRVWIFKLVLMSETSLHIDILKSDSRLAQRHFLPSADKYGKNLVVSNSAHISICSAEVKSPIEKTRRHFWASIKVKNYQLWMNDNLKF